MVRFVGDMVIQKLTGNFSAFGLCRGTIALVRLNANAVPEDVPQPEANGALFGSDGEFHHILTLFWNSGTYTLRCTAVRLRAGKPTDACP